MESSAKQEIVANESRRLGDIYKLNPSEKFRRMLIARAHLLNSPYIYYIQGGREGEDIDLPEEERDKFAGYEGFVYRSGKVIFYQFYKDKDRTKIAEPGATYIMDIDKFPTYSRLKKGQIIAAKRQGLKGVTRNNHGEDMTGLTNRMDRAMDRGENGPDRTDEVMEKVSFMVREKVLKRKVRANNS